MKILLIGGTRFIGAHTVRHLHDAGSDVTVLHRGTTANRILPDVEHVLDPGAAYPILSFPNSLRRAWDVVVHMVAMGRADTETAVQTFAGITRRFVLVSSCDVYRAYGRLTGMEPGPVEPTPLSEDAPLRTVLYPYRGMEARLGAYAHDYDKILAEAAVLRAEGFDWTILRLPKVYGPEDNADLATVYDFAAVPDWRWTHGHVTNVASAIANAALHPAAGASIFNLGEASTPTMGERLGRLPRRPGAPPELPPFDFAQPLVTDTSKIRRVLNYTDVIDEPAAMAGLAM